MYILETGIIPAKNIHRFPQGPLALMINNTAFIQAKSCNPWANKQLRRLQLDVRNTVTDAREHKQTEFI